MSTDPYIPPSAPVRDIEPERRRARPKAIQTAVLLWTAVTVVAFGRESYRSGDIAIVLFLFLPLGLLCFLLYKIFLGRNWARLSMAALFVLGSWSSVPHMFNDFARFSVERTFDLALFSVQLVALFLLFTKPGSIWFKRSEAASRF